MSEEKPESQSQKPEITPEEMQMVMRAVGLCPVCKDPADRAESTPQGIFKAQCKNAHVWEWDPNVERIEILWNRATKGLRVFSSTPDKIITMGMLELAKMTLNSAPPQSMGPKIVVPNNKLVAPNGAKLS